MKKFLLMMLMCMAALSGHAHAALNVLACEPEWASLVREIGGDRVMVAAATTALQDPHRIEARPALLAQARRASLLVCTGASLEIGWLPLLQRESGNAAIQPGRPGYFEAARHVPLIERPAVIDRAHGDVHAEGNPHLHLDPRNLLPVSAALAQRMGEIDAANAAFYATRQREFATRLQAAIARWEKDAEALRGSNVVTHHKTWSYLANWLGLRVVAELEPKPGIEPSAAYLGGVLETLKNQRARMVLRTPYETPRASEWVAQRAGIAAVELPYTVGGAAEVRDLFSLFDVTLQRLQAGVK